MEDHHIRQSDSGETGKVFGENEVIQNVNSSSSVITGNGKTMRRVLMKTSVYGKATLKKI